MKTTRLSAKGQVILPNAKETPEGVLSRPLRRFHETRLEDVVGCLKYTEMPATVEEMDQAIALEIKKRHDSGRY